jgi:hypothetical protein
VVVAVVSLLGASVAACTPPPDPTAPTGLATSLTATGFDVSWDPMSGATGYELHYQDADVAGSPLLETEASEPTTSLTGLVDGHRYRLYVKARFGDVSSNYSDAIKSFFVVPVLPAVRVETDGHEPIVSKDDSVTGTFSLDPGNGGAPVTTSLEIHGRGNTTWDAPKKPYKLKLGTSSALLGMPASKHWVLLADYFDVTHLRNPTGFALSAQTSLAWTPRTRQVELVLNGQYEGLYELAEHVRIARDRVNIDAMTPSDIAGDALTGGYLAEVDNQEPEPGEYTFDSPRNLIHLDDPEVPTAEQRAYIKADVRGFESALYSPTFADPTTGYAAYLDVNSMVDYYLVQEVIRNQDAFIGSTWFTKPRLGKLQMGPLWDIDNSLGNTRGWDSGSATGWFVRRSDLKWMGRFFDDPAFVAAVAARWQVLRPRFEAVADQIVADGDAIAVALAHDKLIWDYKPTPVDTPQRLADWLHARIAWMDANIQP